MVHALYAVLGPRDATSTAPTGGRMSVESIRAAGAPVATHGHGPARARARDRAPAPRGPPRPAAEHGRVARPLYASNHAVTRALYSHTRTGQWLDTTRHDTTIAN